MDLFGIFTKNVCPFCSCAAFACAAAVFYKKSFKKDMIPLTLLFIGIGSVAETTMMIMDQSPVSTAVTCFLLMPVTCYYANSVSNKPILSFMIYFLALMDLRSGWFDDGLVQICGFRYHVIARMMTVAIPQFLRSPSIKAKLQGVRAKAGPVFVLYTVRYACQAATSAHSWNSVVIACAAASSAVCAVLAGIVFRPDNSAILELFYRGTKLRQRKMAHRFLMITSFVMITSCVGIMIAESLPYYPTYAWRHAV